MEALAATYLAANPVQGGAMPHYRIEIIPLRENEPGGGAVPNQETRRFTNLGDALQRAREMYRRHDTAAKGFRIFNAADELLHEWIP